jgi:methionine-rich copper-binding protein CopC
MRKLLLSLCFAGLALCLTPIASAHVEIVSSFPDQFSNVNPIPTQVWIEFSGDLQNLDGEIVNSLEVTDSTGYVMSSDDSVVEAGRITTKISEQSAAGVFIVKYRVVGQDGHVIEGEYTFNASPEYAEAVPTTTAELEKTSSPPIGIAVFVLLLMLGAVGYFIHRKSEKK